VQEWLPTLDGVAAKSERGATALAQQGPHALGNHAGEEVLRKLAADAGLRSWRLAVETPTNCIYEVKR
jgi:hypothetical protein